MQQTFRTLTHPPMTAARPGVALGLAVHLGPLVAVLGWLTVSGVDLFHVVASTAVVGFGSAGLTEWLARRRPLEPLPALGLRRGLGILAWHIVGKGLLVGVALLLAIWGLGALLLPGRTLTHGPSTVIAVLLIGDFAYYAIHRWLYHSTVSGSRFVSWARRQHWMHHRVEHLDFLRGNIGSLFDNGVISFPIPTALAAVLLGLDLPGTLLVYMILMNLQVTHHANAEFDLGPLRYVFVSDRSHKMHHCIRGHLVNFGGIFAFWDLAFGSFYDPRDVRPSALHHQRRPLPITRARLAREKRRPSATLRR